MRVWIWILFFVVPTWSFASQRSLPFFEPDQLTPYWPSDTAAERGQPSGKPLTPATVTEFELVGQDGRRVTEKSFQNQVTLVNFFFADCPSLCPTMMSSIQRFQKKLGAQHEGVKIYSFSVKPEKDSPKRLREYAKAFGIDLKNWTLLTGKRSQVYRIGKEVFKADGSVGAQKSESSFIHTKNIYIVDPKLRIRGVYDTSDPNAMALLVQDIVQLKKERRE